MGISLLKIKSSNSLSDKSENQAKYFGLTLDNWIAIITIILSFIAIIVGGLLSGYYHDLQTKEQKKIEISNYAQAFLNEIDTLEPNLIDQNNYYKQSFKMNDSTAHVTLTPFYPKSGLHYTLNKKIYLFDRNLSTNLNIFYGDLINAEADREFIVNSQKFIEITPNYENTDTMQYKQDLLKNSKIVSNDMKYLIINASELLPTIRGQLNEEL